MGVIFSTYIRILFGPDTDLDRPRAGEDNWLNIENVPEGGEEFRPTLPSKKCSKKKAEKYAESRRPVDRSQIRCEMTVEERMFADVFGECSHTEDPGKERSARKRSDRELDLSEVKLTNEDSDSSIHSTWSDLSTDEQLTFIHTEDLTRRGITRQIAVKMASECELSKQNSERNANQLKPSVTGLPSYSGVVARQLARWEHSTETTTSGSKYHADNAVKSTCNSPKLPSCSEIVTQQNVMPGNVARGDGPTDRSTVEPKKKKQKFAKLRKMFAKKSKPVLVKDEVTSCNTDAIVDKQSQLTLEDVKPTTPQTKVPKGTMKPSKKVRDFCIRPRTSSNVDPGFDDKRGFDAESAESAPSPMKRPSDIYRMFEGSTLKERHFRPVLSMELDEEYTKAYERTKAPQTDEKSTKKTRKFLKFWKRDDNLVTEFKYEEPPEDTKVDKEAKTSKPSKFSIFKRKKTTPVKPFKAPKQVEKEVKWVKIKMSTAGVVAPKPTDLYKGNSRKT